MMNFLPPPPLTKKIHFYDNLTSGLKETIYCFSSEHSMNLFQTSNGKYGPNSIELSGNNVYDGVPLFSCELKLDSSYFVPFKATNYIIYKYVTVSSKELECQKESQNDDLIFVTKDDQLQISVFKHIYCEVKNSNCFSFSKRKTSHYSFAKDFLQLRFYNFNDSIGIEKSLPFEGCKWVYRDGTGNIFSDAQYVDDHYTLVGNGGNLAAYNNCNRTNKWVTTTAREKVGELDLPYPNTAADAVTTFLSLEEEYIVCMSFGLIHGLREIFGRNKKSNDSLIYYNIVS